MNTSQVGQPIVTGDILVVEDNHASLKLLVNILTKAGYRVRPASNGELALRSSEAKPPELILLDIRLPGMDGYEVCRRLKANAHTREIPIIFISALGDTVDKLKAFDLGGVDFINKPYQDQEVLARARTHLRLHRTELELKLVRDNLEERVQERTAEFTRTNKLLGESEQRFKRLLNGAANPIFVHNTEGNFVDINHQACLALGYERAELLEMSVSDIDPLFQPEELSSLLTSLKPDQPKQFESIHKRRDKSRFPVEITVAILDLDDKPHFIAIANDISNRKEAEAALKASEEKYRTIINNTGVGIAQVDLNGRFFEVNDAYASMLGYSTQELLGMLWKEVTHPDEVAKLSRTHNFK
jgi:PAS domain S-box-containing protein